MKRASDAGSAGSNRRGPKCGAAAADFARGRRRRPTGRADFAASVSRAACSSSRWASSCWRWALFYVDPPRRLSRDLASQQAGLGRDRLQAFDGGQERRSCRRTCRERFSRASGVKAIAISTPSGWRVLAQGRAPPCHRVRSDRVSNSETFVESVRARLRDAVRPTRNDRAVCRAGLCANEAEHRRHARRNAAQRGAMARFAHLSEHRPA